GDRAFRLATSITGSEQDAEEVVQDAFWAVVRKIDTFRGESAFGSWLYRIVANAAYQKLRGQRSRGRDLSLDEVLPSFDAWGSHSVRIMNQLAGADVKSLEGTLEACGATAGLVDGRRSELPACRLRRVTQHVQENLQRELRLAELSALVHMSPYHFARLFKRSTGVPPHKFLVRRRIDEARALLEARTVPIAEISRLVGFRTPSHFTTTFRRITGMTP